MQLLLKSAKCQLVTKQNDTLSSCKYLERAIGLNFIILKSHDITFQDARSKGELPSSSNRTNSILHSLKMHIEAFCRNSTAGQEVEYGEKKKDSLWRPRCRYWYHSLWGKSDCSSHAKLRMQVTHTLVWHFTLSQWLGWVSSASGRDGWCLTKTVGAGAHRHQVKDEDGLGYFDAHSWKFELKTEIFTMLLVKRRQNHFVDLRRCEEISSVLLGCIKIWAL